ncbi:MAG: 50S ribosomal protein L5 [Candidatus Freyarchaeota archaeon]|nr:50S ribosomal protein L5 [Candidatus Freyrarchaeum guaymaensis]
MEYVLDEKSIEEKWKNPMFKPFISKVVVNIGVGASGERLVKAMKVLESLTGQKPVECRAKRTIRDFGIRKREPIGCKVTLRGEAARTFLEKALDAVERTINPDSFDEHGNVSFGIREHIDIPGTRYDPNLGVFGMDVCVSFERAGYRVKRRRRRRSRMPKKQRVTKEEAMLILKKEFNVVFGERRRRW